MKFITKEIKSFKDAWHGMVLFFRNETHAKFHAIAMLAAVSAGFYFHISASNWIAVLICIGMVISVEALNTAVEKMGDMVHKDYHPQMRHIKDIAAGAVLFTSLIAAIVAMIIFIPELF